MEVKIKMKRFATVLLSVLLLVVLCACGSMKKTLLSTTWVNVNDGDEYVFQNDGKGTHGDVEISYKIEEGEIIVTEGVASAKSKTFALEDAGDMKKLIAKDEDTYYVPAEKYEEIGEKVRKENMAVLTSVQAWKTTSNNTAFLMFLESSDGKKGVGYWLTTGTTLWTNWEMVDNNTVKIELEYDGSKMSQVLDIVTKDGQSVLADASTGQVRWTQSKQ